jgi:hypothetical protein
MTNHVARLYAVVTGLLVFFVGWAAVAAHPWATAAKQDPRLAALAARQQQVQAQSIRVKQIVDRRFAAYRAALAKRNATNATAASLTAAAPSVRVVTLPPLTITRTS